MATKKETAKEVSKETTKEVVFNKNVKYGKQAIPAGQKVEIQESDYDALVEAGHIDEK